MAALIPKHQFLAANQQICAAAAAVQVCHYSQKVKTIKNPTTASLRRGTGGRSSWNGLICTIFGPSGMLGRHLANRLGKIGTQMIIPHRCDFYDVAPIKLNGDLGQVLFHPFDLRDEESILRSIKYSNVVVNLIGRDYETKNFSFEDVHVTGAATLARICKQQGVERFIHVSCLNAHPSPKPLLMKNGSEFYKSKYHGEVAVRKEFPDATIIRPATIYAIDDIWINSVASRLRQHLKGFPCYKKGEMTEKQPIHVSDVVAGIVAAIKDPSSAGRTYQFVGPNRYKLSDLLDWMHEHLRREAKDYGFRRLDIEYWPLFQAKINLINMMSPAYPIARMHWEQFEQEATSDRVIKGIPTLEDLGVTPKPPDTLMPFELIGHKFDAYYQEDVGEFPDIIPPKPVKPKFYEGFDD